MIIKWVWYIIFEKWEDDVVLERVFFFWSLGKFGVVFLKFGIVVVEYLFLILLEYGVVLFVFLD